MKINQIYLLILWLISSVGSFYSQEATFTVYFENDSARLNHFKQEIIGDFIENISRNEITDVQILAYCSDKGSSSYNDSLSNARANFIKTVVTKHNLSESVISICKGKGEIASSSSRRSKREKEWSQNRKVDIVVVYKNTESTPIQND